MAKQQFDPEDVPQGRAAEAVRDRRPGRPGRGRHGRAAEDPERSSPRRSTASKGSSPTWSAPRRRPRNAVDEANKLVARAASKTAAAAERSAGSARRRPGRRDEGRRRRSTTSSRCSARLHDQDKAAVDGGRRRPRSPRFGARVAELEQVGPKLPPLIRNELATLTKVLQGGPRRGRPDRGPLPLPQRLRPVERPGALPLRVAPEADSVALDDRPDPERPRGQPRARGRRPRQRQGRDGRGGARGDPRLRAEPASARTTLVRIAFDHLSFKAGSSGKAEVDVVIQKIEFVGILAFVEAIKELIPFDGFSDPPFLDVNPQGLTAGFTLALPSLSIGVFTLSNMSLGADVQVPFLGKTTSVGFNFCTRERPFTLAVVFLGGGGWFGHPHRARRAGGARARARGRRLRSRSTSASRPARSRR